MNEEIYSKYEQRQTQLNDPDREVWDSIDRPIQPLVWELNRVGLPTKFSCCGFTYQGEEEPKTHAKKPFVVFFSPQFAPKEIQNFSLGSFFSLAGMVAQTGWELRPYSKREWHLMFKSGNDNEFYQEAGELPGIHSYETKLLHIQRLAKALQGFPSVDEKFSIVDGNSSYAELTNNEWQVKPKKPKEFRSAKKPYRI